MITIGVDARSALRKEPRGEGRSLIRLYEEVLRLRPDLRVWFFGDSAAADIFTQLPPGVKIDVSANWGHRISGWENFSLPWKAIHRRCDVLHCASSTAPVWSPVPVVLTVHDLIPALQVDGHDAQARESFLRGLKRGARQARRVIAVSDHTRQDLLSLFPELEQKSTVIHWGCDTVVPDNEPALIHGKYFVTFGGSAPRKNTEYTIERFASIAPLNPGIRLVIIGIGSTLKRESLFMLAEKLGVRDAIDIPGFVDERTLNNIVENACALLYFSRYEGFGLPVLESIVRGVPVLTSDRSSLPEILAGVPGCMCLDRPAEIEAVLNEVARDSALRQNWAVAQRAVLEKFRWETTASRTLNSLLSAIG